MSARCKFVDRTKSPNVECGYLAQPGGRYGYCPRHELLVPALEAERAEKERRKREAVMTAGDRRPQRRRR